MMNKKRLKQFSSGVLPNAKIFNKVLDPFPMSVHFAMTNRCNLSCTFCGQAKDKWHKEDELTFEQYKDLIDQVAAMKNRTVSFFGGEVFLYRDIEKVLEYCHRQKLTIEMVLTFGGCPWGRARQRKYGVRPNESVTQEAGEAPYYASRQED